MTKLIRYYNQNRKKIWKIIIIIFSAFVLLQLVNYYYKIEDEKQKQQMLQNRTSEEINSTNVTTLTENKSVVTGKKVQKDTLQTATTVIDNFINYCNNHELEKAYNLLTKDCKTYIYKTQDMFEKAYYENVFEGSSKNCTVENWEGDIYKVRIAEDMLSTGKNNQGFAKEDYMLVKKEDGEYKLNINNFIGHREINETTQKDDIKVEVIEKNIYMENEEYKIKVTNNTESRMLLDTRSEPRSLYLEDKKGNKYPYYANELTDPMLTVEKGQTKEITIKFYSTYREDKNIQHIVFSDIILNNGQRSEKIIFKANT